MPDIYLDVDVAVVVPVNMLPLLDDTDFKTIETAVVYNSAGLVVTWNFITSAGVQSGAAITPTTAGVYDWAEPIADKGIYTIEIPASGGASANNNTEGYGWISGVATGVLPFRGPIIGFRAAALNDALCDGGDNLDVNTVQWLGTACATPTVAGVPEVDLTHVAGATTNVAALATNVDAILTDTGTTLETHLTDVKGATFAGATDSLEAIRDRGDAAWTTGAGGSDRLLMVDTTIATLATQVSFTLTAGSADNDAYNNCTIIIEDVSTATQKAVGMVLDYVGATKTITLKEALAFTIAATDKVYILAENSLKSTVANRQLDVTATGAAGIDWGNVENPTTAVDLSATDIQLCDTTTTNTDMRGTNSAALASVCTEGRLAELDAANLPATTDAILVDTAVIGALGAGLTAVPWNAAWDAEVQSECADALTAYAPLKSGVAMTEGYAADGATATPEQILYMIWAACTEFAIAGTTITAKKLDGTTTAFTHTLDEGTNPTSRTRAT